MVDKQSCLEIHKRKTQNAIESGPFRPTRDVHLNVNLMSNAIYINLIDLSNTYIYIYIYIWISFFTGFQTSISLSILSWLSSPLPPSPLISYPILSYCISFSFLRLLSFPLLSFLFFSISPAPSFTILRYAFLHSTVLCPVSPKSRSPR